MTYWFLTAKTLVISFLLGSCSSNPCDNPTKYDKFNYKINVTRYTSSGIGVDGPKDLNLDLVDAIVDETERCLLQHFPNKKMKYWDAVRNHCASVELNIPLERAGLTLKVPNDYIHSKIDGQELLNVSAPPEVCSAKGICMESDCEDCKWRAGVQDGCVAVTTPSLYMLKDPLVKIMTRCLYIWGQKEFAVCASPVVPKDGVIDNVNDLIFDIDGRWRDN